MCIVREKRGKMQGLYTIAQNYPQFSKHNPQSFLQSFPHLGKTMILKEH